MENIAKHCLLTRVYASLGWFGRAVFDLTVHIKGQHIQQSGFSNDICKGCE
jgi:hypothetical protein